MDITWAIQLAMSLPAALGFALFFNVSRPHIIIAAIGGLLSWGCYELCSYGLDIQGVFIPCLIASTFAAVYAEILARRCNAPTSVFFIIAVIPLVPGRGLFYTMSNAVQGQWSACATNALTTLLFAAGIAVGICIVTAVVQTWEHAHAKIQQHHEQ